MAGGTPARPGWARLLWLVFGILILGPALHAHNPDTSYCRIEIGREEVAFTFTFDLATIARITPIDADRDGRVTFPELGSAAPALDTFLRQHVFIELNEREAVFGPLGAPSWPEDAGDSIPADDYGQRLISLTFRNAVLHAPDAVAVTFDFFAVVGDRHTVLGKFVWNGQENAVNFSRFEPDYLFDTGYRVPAWDQFTQYLRLGVDHILHGYDHVAFLLALLFVRRFVELLKIITAFSVAHTITLALAALGVMTVPSRLVESVIAASIVYVAAENMWRRSERPATATPIRPSPRWRITFAFGLVHGFGFASVLRELGLPADGLVRSLLAFNLGVELGQIGIAVVCWPLLVWIARTRWSTLVRMLVSSVLLLFGLAWLVDRVFGPEMMPF